MDKKIVKQLVAREGLVIILLLMLGTFFYSMSISIPVKEPASVLEISLGGTVYKLTQEGATGAGQNAAMQEIFGLTSERSSQETFWQSFTRSLKGIAHRLSFFFYFLAYPLYWLIRFIDWAVRTLKEQ